MWGHSLGGSIHSSGLCLQPPAMRAGVGAAWSMPDPRVPEKDDYVHSHLETECSEETGTKPAVHIAVPAPGRHRESYVWGKEKKQ